MQETSVWNKNKRNLCQALLNACFGWVLYAVHLLLINIAVIHEQSSVDTILFKCDLLHLGDNL